MAQINENFLKLQSGYLFPEIARRVNNFLEQNPDKAKRLIKLGIGDVTEPLPKCSREAMIKAVTEMGTNEGFHGYGPEKGYEFLRSTILKNKYNNLPSNFSTDEIFISDGSKCDTANILDIFAINGVNKIAIPNPVYPVYVDTNIMIGNTGNVSKNGTYEGIVYLNCNKENNFQPDIPNEKVDLIYLCYPNNPTGATASKNYLKKWVDYALKNDAIILFDAAYEGFIREEEIPHSIYEIENANKCCIEFGSFSKSAGFTGTRCAWTVVPHSLVGKDSKGKSISLNNLWNRRQSTKFNGASYIIQKGAEASLSEEGKNEIQSLTDFYMKNASILHKALSESDFKIQGGKNAPYLWINCPESLQNSWDFFDDLLNNCQIVCTPGSGFGSQGEGYFRLSAFNSRKNILDACDRITQYYK